MIQKLLTLQWHITESCERRCTHCYMYDEKTYNSRAIRNSDMDIHLCFKAILQFDQLCKKLSSLTGIKFKPKYILSGGDPLLHPEIFKIIDEVRKYTDQIEILGNADLLNYETASKLSDCGVKRYQISLDGRGKMHDKIRGKGSFQTSVNGLRTLTKAGIKTAVMFTLFKDNMNELSPLINEITMEETDSFSFSRVSSFGNARELNSAIKPLEYRELLSQIHYLQTSLQKKNCRSRFPLKDHLWKLFLYEKGEYKLYPHYKTGKTVNGCHMAQSFMVLLSDGTSMACRRFYSPIGNFPEQTIPDIFLHSKEIKKYRKVKNMQKCSKCELLFYCRGCPAVSHGYHKDWQKTDPQCWKV